MGYLGAYALPVVSGQEDRVRNFDKELRDNGLVEAFEELNRNATVSRYATFLQEDPTGGPALAITTLEVDDPTRLQRQFGDTAYDRWWTAYLSEVHGLPDLTGVPVDQMPSPPPLVYSWDG